MSTSALFWFLLLLLIVAGSSGRSSSPGRLRRNADALTTTTDPTKDDDPSSLLPGLEKRMGRAGSPASPVQAHRSNVAKSSSPPGPAPRVSQPRLPGDDGSIPPAPPIDVTDIRCLKMASRERFTAVISASGGLTASPIFEEMPSIDPLTSRVCQIQPSDKQAGSFQLEVTNLDACGVRPCTGVSDGHHPWLCLTLRFPVLAGLKLPEDEIVEIRCKQQDRTVAERKDIDFDGESFSPRVEQKSPVTFSGGRQEFLCEIGLFRRLPGTSLFSQRIGPGTAVELGEDVQLRSIVRSNDGWFYSKMTDVTVRRLKKSTGSAGDKSAALVLADGCRNPAYKAIAPLHPQRDARSSLLNHFNFRVFLFQDMEDGDSILVSARVIACVEAIDCAPTLCGDDRGQGSGRRRRRRNTRTGNETDSGQTREIFIEQYIYPNGTAAPGPASLKGWETELALKVAMPGEYGASRLAHLGSLDESQCFLYLMLTVGLGTALGVTALLVTIYCIYHCKRGQNKSVPRPGPPAESATTSPSSPLESLMELQVLDALSRSVRQKKQHVHEEIMKFYGGVGADSNVYTADPSSSSSSKPSVRQLKRQQQHSRNVTTVTVGREDPSHHYWEIGQHQILPPTAV